MTANKCKQTGLQDKGSQKKNAAFLPEVTTSERDAGLYCLLVTRRGNKAQVEDIRTDAQSHEWDNEQAGGSLKQKENRGNAGNVSRFGQ